jgi:hypothetical protein
MIILGKNKIMVLSAAGLTVNQTEKIPKSRAVDKGMRVSVIQINIVTI